jgi:RND family efflux transporter MFP subunit
MTRVSSSTLLLLALVATGGCRPSAAPSAATPPPSVEIGPENVVVVEQADISVGPLVSGELRARLEATVRAEIGGSVISVGYQEGDAVTRGAVLARIGERVLRDSIASAESDVRSAETSLEWTKRERDRTASLVTAGALAERELELAGNAVAAAEAQLDAARARLASANTLLGDTVVRSPISGRVSARLASAGDVVSPGTELYTIIDPSSMQLEASVPSNELEAVKVGAAVRFTVRGYPGQVFEGRVERISPVADRITRQVPIFAAIPNASGRLVAGLFAEGRVIRETRSALVVPDQAVNRSGATPWVLRVRDGQLERVDVSLGLRDDETERVEVVSGLEAGDQLLVGASQRMSPGTAVRLRERRSE